MILVKNIFLCGIRNQWKKSAKYTIDFWMVDQIPPRICSPFCVFGHWIPGDWIPGIEHSLLGIEIHLNRKSRFAARRYFERQRGGGGGSWNIIEVLHAIKQQETLTICYESAFVIILIIIWSYVDFYVQFHCQKYSFNISVSKQRNHPVY